MYLIYKKRRHECRNESEDASKIGKKIEFVRKNAALLQLLEAFVEAAPMIVLQMYIIMLDWTDSNQTIWLGKDGLI